MSMHELMFVLRSCVLYVVTNEGRGVNNELGPSKPTKHVISIQIRAMVIKASGNQPIVIFDVFVLRI